MYRINRFIRMDGQKILNIVVMIAVILWLLRGLGSWGDGGVDLNGRLIAGYQLLVLSICNFYYSATGYPS